MDYIKRKLSLAIVVLVVLALVFGSQISARASSGAAEVYQSANKAYVELSRSASKRKSRKNWLSVIHKYSYIYKNYPTSGYAPAAKFKTASLYEELYGYSGNKDDLYNAVELYLGLEKRHPTSSLADDALYNAAEIYADLGRNDKASFLFRQIAERYPEGDMQKFVRDKIKTVKRSQERPKRSTGLSLVKEIRYWPNKDCTRVVIDLEKNVSFKTMTLGPDKKSGRPNRVVMDLKGARTPPGMKYKVDVNDGTLSDIRISQFNREKVRVVLDLVGKAYYNTFELEDPSRLVIDVSRDSNSIKKIASYQTNVKKARRTTSNKVQTDIPTIASQFCLKVSRIVIDPGHGGKDPGAISPSGVKEKDVVLTIAKRLAERLERDRFEVYLTRTSDKFLTLEQRTEYANKKKADLFISLHVNSNVDRSVRGIETYFLNLTTDASAIEVAARENATSSKSISDLQLIINDLMLNSKINESSKFADSVHKFVMSSAMNVGYRGRNLGIRQAPFYVLLGAQMPSILIELGFITNSTDCTLLKRRSYQNSLIDGIAKGINNYIMNTTYAYRGRN